MPVESELIVREMRSLNSRMNMTPTDTPLDPMLIRRFRDLFQELDGLLASGAQLPPSWITPEAKTRLKPHETHTITDFDPRFER